MSVPIYNSSLQTASQPIDDFRRRSQGHPVVTFGFGGKLITVIPQRLHAAFSGKSDTPSRPGLVTTRYLGDLLSGPRDILDSFPGPLYSGNGKNDMKSKKSSCIKWLSEMIETFQKQAAGRQLREHAISLEDKLLVYKTMRHFLEHDGDLNLQMKGWRLSEVFGHGERYGFE